jgi:hypothetical protein
MLESSVDAVCIVVQWKTVYENHFFGVELGFAGGQRAC